MRLEREKAKLSSHNSSYLLIYFSFSISDRSVISWCHKLKDKLFPSCFSNLYAVIEEKLDDCSSFRKV